MLGGLQHSKPKAAKDSEAAASSTSAAAAADTPALTAQYRVCDQCVHSHVADVVAAVSAHSPVGEGLVCTLDAAVAAQRCMEGTSRCMDALCE